jgi:hypothetical protein
MKAKAEVIRPVETPRQSCNLQTALQAHIKG